MRMLFLPAVLGLTWPAIVGLAPARAQAIYWRQPTLGYYYPPVYYYAPGLSYYSGPVHVSYYVAPAYTSRYYAPSYYAPTQRSYFYAQPISAPGYPGNYSVPSGYRGPVNPAYDFWSGYYYGR